MLLIPDATPVLGERYRGEHGVGDGRDDHPDPDAGDAERNSELGVPHAGGRDGGNLTTGVSEPPGDDQLAARSPDCHPRAVIDRRDLLSELGVSADVRLAQGRDLRVAEGPARS